MFKTTYENLFCHLRDDLKLEEDALVWLHSGVKGLGLIDDCVKTITDSFSNNSRMAVEGMATKTGTSKPQS